MTEQQLEEALNSWFRLSEAAKYLGVSTQMLNGLKLRGKLHPKIYRGIAWYNKAELDMRKKVLTGNK